MAGRSTTGTARWAASSSSWPTGSPPREALNKCRGSALRQVWMAARRTARRMSATFARRPTTQTPHLPQPTCTAHQSVGASKGRAISGRFVVARPSKVPTLRRTRRLESSPKSTRRRPRYLFRASLGLGRPPPAEGVHEVHREAEVGLAVADECEQRLVQRALRVEHLEVRRVAVLVSHLRKPERVARLLHLLGEIRFLVRREPHVRERIGDVAEGVLHGALVAGLGLARLRL